MKEEEVKEAIDEATQEGELGYRERKRWLFLGLPWTFTVYTVKENVLTRREGFLSIKENDCYMYKIQDVQMNRSLFERILGLGTIICYTGDTTDPKLVLRHIRHAPEIKDFILEYSEKARLKRRTVSTLSIDAGLDALDD